MKTIATIIGFILIGIATFSTPAAIVAVIYQWAVVDVEFKIALWGAVKLWLGMLACVIPGMGLFVFGRVWRAA